MKKNTLVLSALALSLGLALNPLAASAAETRLFVLFKQPTITQSGADA
ncbi:hypothetical protein BN437_2867 [Erwinia amylovora NBRC 12687 = CFBP 1232]|uniref:Uncharacterized protein n=1 Tax=Erwinia amylovora NBRC 12687 = CFBP 1232 TaxID=1219359 RepID=A0A831A407_ERWAM|nr:hypothetical protein BN437_2867 [Erwinia amylovora NBRC 12687 = CFBP 1232]